MAETGLSGNLKARYLRGVGLLAQAIDGKSFYYLHNAHGDVVQRVGESGDAAPLYRYDAFGNQREPVETDPNPFRYCGEYFDGETQSVYLRNRYYDARIGRFSREDPARHGLNWYAYSKNNPVMFVDPTGLFSIAFLPGNTIEDVREYAKRHTVEDYMQTEEYKKYSQDANFDPWAMEQELGRRATTYPVKSNTKGTTYENHGNSLDFTAPKDTSIHSTSGGYVERVDWGFSDDYAVRPYKYTDANGKARTTYYEVEVHSSNYDDFTYKRDSSGQPIKGFPYGNSVRIRMDEGRTNLSDGPLAIYAHMAYSEAPPVQVGDYVFINQQIGTVGNTGNSGGNHLHYEILNTNKHVSYYLP